MINKMTDKLSVSEYIRLIRAGYTAEQIEQEYGTEPSESAPEPIIEPAEETVTAPEKPAEAPKPEPVQASNPSLDALLAEIKLLRGDMLDQIHKAANPVRASAHSQHQWPDLGQPHY